MKKLQFLLAAVFVMLIALPVSARYIVYSVSGDISVKRGSNAFMAKVGQELLANDEIVIRKDDKIEILNNSNSKIYASTKSGIYTVSQIIDDANAQADDHSSNIIGNIRIASSSGTEGSMYVESGKVTRALADFDPAGDSLRVESRMLGNFVAEAIRNINDGTDTGLFLPLEFTALITGAGVAEGYELTNNLDFPVYFNVIKLSGPDHDKISISELGQPIGSYVLLPSQSITRRQHTGLNPAERHVLVFTHYYFDIDELISQIDGIIGVNAPVITVSIENPPFYVKAL